jgi:hypothetical protein
MKAALLNSPRYFRVASEFLSRVAFPFLDLCSSQFGPNFMRY